MKIMIVEDDPFIAENTKIILKRNGFDVFHLNEGSTVHERVLSEVPDLILLDVMMPGSNGIDVCRELKSDTLTKNIPLILLSAKTQPSDVKVGLESGADGYLQKPCRTQELLIKINELLEDVKKRGKDEHSRE